VSKRNSIPARDIAKVASKSSGSRKKVVLVVVMVVIVVLREDCAVTLE
jgi:hypothetical protein